MCRAYDTTHSGSATRQRQRRQRYNTIFNSTFINVHRKIDARRVRDRILSPKYGSHLARISSHRIATVPASSFARPKSCTICSPTAHRSQNTPIRLKLLILSFFCALRARRAFRIPSFCHRRRAACSQHVSARAPRASHATTRSPCIPHTQFSSVSV